MSSWCSGQPLAAASSSNTLTKTVLATGEQVSKKSSPSLCVYPLTTSLTLYLSTEPSELSLILYTHLQAMGVLPGGKGVRTQIFFFFLKDTNLLIHCQAGSLTAWKKCSGSLALELMDIR